MKKLTKAEEEIMQIIWEIGPCTVSQIRTYMEEKLAMKKPPHSTVSTIVRGLDNQGDHKAFLGFKAYGRTYEYFALISKEAYSKITLKSIVKDYFDGSMNRLVSFMVEENDLSLTELNDLIQQLEDQ